jgi:GTPase Era involved in 16S rRNA processing
VIREQLFRRVNKEVPYLVQMTIKYIRVTNDGALQVHAELHTPYEAHKVAPSLVYSN